MNELEYYDQQFEEFKSRFAGKNDFQIMQETLENGGIYSFHIHRFLMAKFPDAILSKSLIPAVKVRPHKEEVGKEAIIKLEDANFTGWLEIEWKGKRIIFREVRFETSIGFSTRAMIAVQDRIGFEELLNHVQRFIDSEYKSKRQIRVINGRDIPIPDASWDELFLPSNIKDSLRNTIESFFSAREQYRKMRLSYKRGVLLVGAPGVGKSQCVKTIAANITNPVVALQIRGDVDEYMVSNTFSTAERLSPSVIVLEDIDKLLFAKKVSLGYLLNVMDGLWSKEGILVVATSNEPDKLDRTLLKRPGRFDRVWEFPLPNYDNRLNMLRFRGGEYFSESALVRCASESEGLSMAAVQEIVVNCLLASMHAQVVPDDKILFESMEALKSQERYCSKIYNGKNDLTDVGFIAKT